MKTGPNPPPPGFQVVDHPGVRVLARTEVAPWVRYVIEGGSTLHDAAGSERDVVALEGRAPVFVIPAKLPRGLRRRGGQRWVVRKYARGGRVLPKLLGDKYLGVGLPRPFHEARVSEEVRERGVPTPRVLAAATYSAGAFYRGDLVTEMIPDASDLVDVLFDNRRKGAGGAGERLDALAASGSLVRVMAEAGLHHRDLHAGNILLQWEGTAPRARILDLDLSRLLPRGARAPASAMVRRLKRSLRKWEGRTGLRLSQREWATLEEAALG